VTNERAAVVLKFGGTSLAGPERLRAAAEIVRREPGPHVVVVSALAGVTDALLGACAAAARGDAEEAERIVSDVEARHCACADALLRDAPACRRDVADRLRAAVARARGSLRRLAAGEGPSESLRDDAVALGEELAAQLFVAALRAAGRPAEWVDARRVVRTDGRFGRASIREAETAAAVRAAVVPRLERATVVLQGFVGSAPTGATTTLGRGGSDTTAAALGAALRAREIQIWTDVDGILSADPRIVPNARPISELGFEEAIELAYFGARVLHPSAAKHAAAAGIPIRVRNTFRPEGPGTLVRPDERTGTRVVAVACRGATALVTVRSLRHFMAHGFLARVFDAVARARVPVDLVATSHTSTGFTIADDEPLDDILAALEPFCETRVERGFATLSVIGSGLLREAGTLARVFSVLADVPVRLVTQASDVSLNLLVRGDDAAPAMRRLHAALVEPPPA
jgi:aspartate kinase